MLDHNALSQLQTLKQEIRSSVPRFTGTVRASKGRYGFVNTEQGQSYFLAPDEMDKVLPQDVIEFKVEANKDGKEQAIIEKLIHSEIKEFFGTYIIRGKGHFIEPDHPTFKRFVFVPPKLRKGAVEGDLVRAHISLHPFDKHNQGKTQAEIDQIIGNNKDAFVEQNFTLAKWELPTHFSQASTQAVEAIKTQAAQQPLSGRIDLSHLAFVTIDSASTRDLDDALFAEAQSDGWSLWIAIADPSAWIQAGSQLDADARARNTSVYLPDMVIPMLPPELSEQVCSLQENELRPALVVELRINEDGAIRQTHIHQALIKSRAKLSYTQVAQLIETDQAEISADLHGPLLHLHDCANALSQWRQTHALVMDERADYKLILNENGAVEDIIKLERTLAHRIVEEAMLACNRSVANWLAEQNTGFFIEHGGIRSERLGDAAKLLQEQLELEDLPELANLSGFVKANQQAEKSGSSLPLRSILSRQQERSNLSLEAKPHFGLGFEHYTTFSSPLRKYNDLILHRLIKQILNDEQVELPSIETLGAIQAGQNKARLAALQVENWLKCQWLAKQDKEQLYEASITYITPFNVSVRLDNTGIEGSIELKKNDNWQYNSQYLSVSKDSLTLLLGQAVRVKLIETQPQAGIAKFLLVE